MKSSTNIMSNSSNSCTRRCRSRVATGLLWGTLAVVTLLSQPVEAGIICFFFGAPRCFLGLGSIMHQGSPGTPECEETCAFFFFAILNFFAGYSCGSCTPGGDDGLLIPQENDPSGFGLDVFGVNIPSADAGAFVNAANTWNAIITTDTQGPYSFQTLTDRQPADDLLDGCVYPSNGVDDMLICADIRSIDGVGNVLGAAAPGLRDSGTNRPITGFMFFDSADLPAMKQNGSYETVILHEMGHVLGIGTLWRTLGLQTSAANCPYIGVNANREYRRITGCTSNTVRTEQNGNAGSRCSHWMEESCLRNEVMSSAYNANSRLTSITIGSLQDLGYAVDYTRNQDQSFTQNGSCCRRRDLGEPLPLSLSPPPPPPPRRQLLSDEGIATAVAFGQEILIKQADQATSRGVGLDEFYGVVSVLMLENDQIYEVLVNRDGLIVE